MPSENPILARPLKTNVVLARSNLYREFLTPISLSSRPECAVLEQQGGADLRMTKVRQKISGCFRTEEGAEDFCTLRTVIETAGKQGWDILQTLKTAPSQLVLMHKTG